MGSKAAFFLFLRERKIGEKRERESEGQTGRAALLSLFLFSLPVAVCKREDTKKRN